MGRGRTKPQVFWAPDTPEEVEFKIMELSYGIDNFIPPLAAASRILELDMQERFKTGTDPDGNAWKDWTKEYRQNASMKNRRVFPDRASLYRKGTMSKSLKGGEHWRQTDREVFLDTSGFDEKWAWHNFGRASRKRGGTLPKREFVGMSEGARAAVVGNFYAWMDGLVTVATTERGTTFFRHSTKGGYTHFPHLFSPRMF